MNEHAQFCQIGTAGKGMPCLANINTLAGLAGPCEVCAKTLPKMREIMGWVPFRGFYISNKLADFQHDALLDRIKAANAEEDSADGLHNHRCSMDHPPCPVCELLEEREHEREDGL